MNENLLLQEICQRCTENPKKTAIIHNGHTVSYETLLSLSEHYGKILETLDIKAGDRIGIHASRSIPTFSLLLACLRYSIAFTPIDAHYHSQRVSHIIKKGQLKIIISDEDFKDSQRHEVPVLSLTAFTSASPHQDLTTHKKESPLGFDAPLCIIYTSGSTGFPKAVVRSQRNVFGQISFLFQNKQENQNHIVAQISPLNFVPSVVQFFGSLAIGATLSIIDDFYKLDPEALINKCNQEKITKISLVPSLVELVHEVIETRRLSFISLKKIISTGETLSRSAIKKHQELLSNVQLTTVYGSTEVGGIGWYNYSHDLLEEAKFSLYPGVKVKILDEHFQSVSPMTIGEVCVSSDAVANYEKPLALQKKIKTEDSQRTEDFFPTGDYGYLDKKGRVILLGRNDDQVKINSQRIHLEEINRPLSRFPNITKSLVLFKDKQITFYFTAKTNISEISLKEHAKKHLPETFIPHHYIRLESFPLLSNGKIDRQALSHLKSKPDLLNSFEVSSKLEDGLKTLWGEVLGVPPANIDPNAGFFDLGGDSLLVVRLSLKVKKTFFNYDIKVNDFFTYPTLKAFCDFLLSQKVEHDENPLVCSPTKKFNQKKDDGPSRDIAVIGMACRFPGADTIESYWKNLVEGTESIKHLTKQEVKKRQDYSFNNDLDASIIPAVFELDDTEWFDAEFFGFTETEAQLLDPQHRVMLEVSWHALEHAGYISELSELKKGIFVGSGDSKYFINNLLLNNVIKSRQELNFAQLLNSPQFLATRLAFALNTQGPALNINTACSTSLVAVSLACESIRMGNCDIAIAGGVSLNLPDESLSIYQPGGILSEDGICRPFDRKAGGTLFSSGAGIVVLKNLKSALKDKDNILAVIKGVSVNNDGKDKVGFAAPSLKGQVQCIKNALADAGISPHSITYIEAHGTGTKLGDPIEVSALSEAMESKKTARKLCGLGSVKGNIGHTNVASGVAGLIKSILCLHHKKIVPSINFTQLNPEINLDHSSFYISRSVQKWEKINKDTPLRACVNSLGIGGTNAHVVLEEAQEVFHENISKDLYFLVFSAKNLLGLEQQLIQMSAFLERNISEPNPNNALANIEFTLWHGRLKFPYRFSLLCSSMEEALLKIRKKLEKKSEQETKNANYHLVFLKNPNPELAEILYDLCPSYQKIANNITRKFIQEDFSVLLQNISFETKNSRKNKKTEKSSLKIRKIQFILSYTFARFLVDLGIEPKLWSGNFLGLVSYLYIKNHISLDEVTKILEQNKITSLSPIYSYKLLDPKAVSDSLKSASYFKDLESEFFIDVNHLKELSLLKECDSKDPIQNFNVPLNHLTSLYELFSALWDLGLDLDLNDFISGGSRISLPLYVFQKKKYWISRTVNQETLSPPLETDQVIEASSDIEIEVQVLEIWKDLFQSQEINRCSNFYELGGHSLLALQLASKLNEKFKIRSISSDILERSDVQSVVKYIQNHQQANTDSELSKITEVLDETFALSKGQERIWLLDQMYPESSMAHVPVAIKVIGDINTEAFNNALNSVIQKHEMLRSYIVAKRNNPEQKISVSPKPFRVLEVQLDSEDNLHRTLQTYAKESFVLTKPYLFRVYKITTPSKNTTLFFVFHHLIIDSWSLGIFWADLELAYQAQLNKKVSVISKVPTSYREYVGNQQDLQNTNGFNKETSYWKDQLAELSQTIIPHHNINQETTNDHEIDIVTLTIENKVLLKKIEEICVQNQCSNFVFFLSIFLLLLFYYTGNEDLSTISMFANRKKKEEQEIIGLFSNPHILRLNISTLQSLKTLLHQTKTVVFEALKNQSVPFELINKEVLLNENLNSIINTLFLFHESHFQNKTFLGSPIKEFISTFPGSIQQDICFELINRKTSLSLNILYVKSLFNRNLIVELSNNYIHLMELLLKRPDSFIKGMNIKKDSIKKKTQSLLAGPSRDPYPLESHLWELFEARVRKNPHKVALIMDSGETLSFFELHKKSQKLSWYLAQKNVGPSDIVGISLPPSFDLIISILAVLKLGSIYLPLDPSYPAARINYYVSHAHVTCVITTKEIKERLFNNPESKGSYILMHEFWENKHEAFEERNQNKFKNELAAIIYTSGSVGDPKGVLIRQQSIINRCYWFEETYGGASDAVGCLSTTINFVDSIAEIFGSLLFGEKLLLIDRKNISDVFLFLSLLKQHQVTKLVLVPSFLEMIIHSGAPLQYLQNLRTLTCSGEVLPASLVIAFLTHLPHIKLLNFYGSTEVMADVTAFDTSSVPLKNLATIPLGKPITHTTIFIVNKYGAILPKGAIGDIYVSGVCLASGYLNNEEKTKDTFVNLSLNKEKIRAYNTRDRGYFIENEELIYRGRADNVIKINGNTVDLTEIESCLNTHSLLKKSVCIITEKNGQKRLIAFVTLAAPQFANQETKSKLFNYLRTHLPRYMVPNLIHFLDQFPVTVNGKINKKALEEFDLPTPLSICEPKTKLQKKIAHLWEDILKINHFSIYDNFFEVGGSSLLAMRLLIDIKESLGVEITFTDIVNNPSIADFEKYIQNNNEKKKIYKKGDNLNLSPRVIAFHSITGLVADYVRLERAMNSLKFFPIAYPYDKKDFFSTLNEMVSYYISLLPVEAIATPPILIGHSMGGILALEAAAQLKNRGFAVEKIILIDTYFPSESLFQRSKIASEVKKIKSLLSSLNVSREDQAKILPLIPHHMRLLGHYIPKPCQDLVFLLTSQTYPDSMFPIWKTILHNYKKISVPGDHYSLFSDPNILQLSATINSFFYNEYKEA